MRKNIHPKGSSSFFPSKSPAAKQPHASQKKPRSTLNPAQVAKLLQDLEAQGKAEEQYLKEASARQKKTAAKIKSLFANTPTLTLKK